MGDRRAVGMVAALGGSIALVALMAGVPGAAADELSDLRANSELLQRRLEQIEEASPNAVDRRSANTTDSPAAVGGSFPRSFLVPGTDTSVRVGGNISETLGYHSR